MKTNGLVPLLVLVLGCVTLHAQLLSEAWVQRYTYERAESLDYGADVKTDIAGNVIVAGNTDNTATASDWLIVKYTGAGVPLWTNRYDGPKHDFDAARSVAVANDGTVFVTGDSFAFNAPDTVTIAYSGAGIPLWTNRFGGPPDAVAGSYSAELAFGQTARIAIGTSGTVFVIGLSYNTNRVADYSTIAYSAAGVSLWTNRFNASDNLPVSVSGEAYALAAANGMVAVTGYFNDGGGSSGDFATIAYSEAGVPLWTNRYNGPANGSDAARSLAISSSGSVCVAGSSYAGSVGDFATLAYSAAGVPLWTNRYSGPGQYDEVRALAVGPNGNVYVTGSSSGSSANRDFTTIAYSESGVPLWTNRYNGPANADDYPWAVTVGTTGNVFVSGYVNSSSAGADYATVAYSAGGVPLWTNRYAGPGFMNDYLCAMAVSPNGTTFVTGSAGYYGYSPTYDSITIAYANDGIPVWTNRYNGQGNQAEQCRGVVVGADGTVVVSGFSQNANYFNNDYATIAYSSAGIPLWTNRYDGPDKTNDQANALALGPNGNVYVTGVSARAGVYLDTDYATVAYSHEGVPLWTNLYNGPANSSDQPAAMAVSPNGTVFVTGTSAYGSLTLAYASAGMPVWTNRCDPLATPVAMAVGADGVAIVTGYFGNSRGFGSGLNWCTVAYTEGGIPLWTNNFDGGTYDSPAAVTVSPDGTAFVVGRCGSAGGADYATIAYSAAGVPLWTNRYNGPVNGDDQATAVGLDTNGTVFVTGSSSGAIGGLDYATIAYSHNGIPLWTNRYNGPASTNDQASALVVSANGTVYVAGSSYNGNLTCDYTTVAYSSAGVPLSTNRYNAPANRDDIVVNKDCLALAPDGVVVVGNTTVNFNSGSSTYDYAVVKYLTTPIVSPPVTNNPPAPTITLSPIGEAQLTFYGTAGSSYVLEHTFDLGSNSWTPVQTNTAALNGTVPFTYLPLGPLNFWRIRPLP